jgi:RND family efflux transporter MFP subunit
LELADIDRESVAWRLIADLLRARTEEQTAAALALAAGILTGVDTARVWLLDRSHGYRLAGAWPEGEKPPDAPPQKIAWAIMFESPSVSAGGKSVRSSLVVPLSAAKRPQGALELLERNRPAGPLSVADVGSLMGLVEAADVALGALRSRVSREADHLEAIARLTRLFDFGRTLASSLEPEELYAAVTHRVRSSLEAQGAYLWIAGETGERLSLEAAAGPMEKAVLGWELPLGEGLAGSVAETGEAAFFDSPDEIPDFDHRPDHLAGHEILTAAAAPVATEEGGVLGVLEVVNKAGDKTYGPGDLIFLREVADLTAVAIENSRRLEADRRAGDLGALLEIAQELGASLEVPRVCLTLVHKAASVLDYSRAAVGLFKNSRLEVAAVSGQTFVDDTLPEMKWLRDALTWAADLEEGIYVTRLEDGTIDAERVETQEKFKAFFESTGSNTFLSVPLQDDEGRLGVFVLEGKEPYAFSSRGLEAASLLAIQATVAIRNAQLYQQVPMFRLFQPLAKRKQAFLRMPRWRRLAWTLSGAAVAAALVAPVPLRIGGDVRVLPDRPIPITAEVNGRISRIFVREGDKVGPGQILAEMDDTEYRMGEADARARLEMTIREENKLRADTQAAGAAIEAARIEGLRAELDLWEARIDRTRIRSPRPGYVATPRVEERVGTALSKGDLLCEIVDPRRQRIEVAVPEAEAGLVRAGMAVKIKLNAYPTRSFEGRVTRLGVEATVQDQERVFLAQVSLRDPQVALRSGMGGQAKIYSGWTPLARVIFRKPVRWLWSVIWGWLP